MEHVDRAPPTLDPEAPLLRVRGLVVMGSVEIRMQLPGETEGEAHRRMRDERRGARRPRKSLPGGR